MTNIGVIYNSVISKPDLMKKCDILIPGCA